MYRRILVPLDGSEFSECALEHVKAIAKGCQVPEVVLLRVMEPIHVAYEIPGDWSREVEEKAKVAAQEYLSKIADGLKKEGIDAKTAILSGQPAELILDYAKQYSVDLIIMSTHGRSAVPRWVFGSVADRIISHSVAPVLAVSPRGCRVG